VVLVVDRSTLSAQSLPGVEQWLECCWENIVSMVVLFLAACLLTTSEYRRYPETFPVIVVGTKSDLVTQPSKFEEELVNWCIQQDIPYYTTRSRVSPSTPSCYNQTFFFVL